MKRLAYFSIPTVNGIYSFYKYLRPKLLNYGWDMKCITIGLHENLRLRKEFVDDGCVSIAPKEKNNQTQIAPLLISFSKRASLADMFMAAAKIIEAIMKIIKPWRELPDVQNHKGVKNKRKIISRRYWRQIILPLMKIVGSKDRKSGENIGFHNVRILGRVKVISHGIVIKCLKPNGGFTKIGSAFLIV